MKINFQLSLIDQSEQSALIQSIAALTFFFFHYARQLAPIPWGDDQMHW